MFVGILLRDSARDFGEEFDSSRHREIFEISSRDQKTTRSHLYTFIVCSHGGVIPDSNI